MSSEWISVEDYPSSNCSVLMTYNNLVMEGEFHNGKFYHPSVCAHVPGYCKCYEQEGITHWMPLPAPPKVYTCFSCGIFHPKVEADGIWHCPNALCRGSGSAWFRRTLKSYSETENMCHTVDEKERLKKGKLHNKKNNIILNN